MTLYLVSFAVFLVLGVPVAFSLGLASLTYLVAHDQLLQLISFPQRLLAGLDNFVLLTIPFFILAGSLMNAANLTQKIVGLAQMLIGRIRGGLAAVNLLSSLMFAGVSGAATAEAAAIGSLMIPTMRRDGYRPAYAAALTAAGSLLGPLIPPSLSLILYGVLTGTSIGDLFLAGIGPALLLGALLLGYVLWRARRDNHPVAEQLPKDQRRPAALGAVPALFLPVIIVVGIRKGIFTPTEAAAVACFYALIIGVFFYRSLSFRETVRCFQEAATLSAGVMIVVAMASMTAFVFARENVPSQIAGALLALTSDPVLLLILLNVILIIFGFFLEPLAALILTIPILSALVPSLGLDPVQFGVMIVLNLMIGMITPPVGLVLFIVGAISGESLPKVSLAALPFIAISLIVLASVAAFPALTLLLPSVLG